MLFGDHRVVELILLVVEFDDRAGQRRAFLDAQALAHRAGDDVAAHDFQRNDLDFADQLLAQVQTLDEVVGHADAVQARHDELADLVVHHALAFENGLLLRVEGGGVVLEILDQGAGLGSFVKDLGLAFVNLLALAVHGPVPAYGRPPETKIARPYVEGEDPVLAARFGIVRAVNLVRGLLSRRRPSIQMRWPAAHSLGTGCPCDGSQVAFAGGRSIDGACPDVSGVDGALLSEMTTFDDREKAFEAKYALDQEQEFKAIARRNRMLGLWAAEKMGLSSESADQYAAAVVRADFEQPGDEDVFRKVAGDFKASGLSVSEGEIRSKIDELASIAREQIRAGE